MTSRAEEDACELLDSISESLSVDATTLVRNGDQYFTRNGIRVYPVERNGKVVYVTVPEE
jgi:predicted transcriptional regulator